MKYEQMINGGHNCKGRRHKQIKFSHRYYKLGLHAPISGAYLISVCKVRLNQLPSLFLQYDTAYPDGYYHLKDGVYLVLLFAPFYATATQQAMQALFTTIRPYTKAKEQFYKNAIGEEFEIVVKGL